MAQIIEIPITKLYVGHATMIAEAFRTEEVKHLPQTEREAKQVEIVRTIAPLRNVGIWG